MSKVTIRPLYNNRSWRPVKTRVYVSGVEKSKDELEKIAKEEGADTIYTSLGDYPVLDKAWKKYNRELVKMMKEVAEKANLTNESGQPLKLNYSRKAGCSCGCSPGFIAENDYNRDIWVTNE